MDYKSILEIQNSITELDADVLAGTGFISEQITALRQDFTKFKKDVEKASEREDKLAVLYLFQDIATVFIGAVLALLAAGIIYY